ncbi:MAG: hypothetical protein ACYCZK_05545 [Microbacteriaceae bacterium]
MTNFPTAPSASSLSSSAGPPDRLQMIRRSAIIVVVVSLSITALIGIATLLLGNFGEVQGRIMLSTLAIGVFGILSLCDLTVAGRRFQWVGYSGILVGVVALTASLIMIWSTLAAPTSEPLWKTFGVCVIAAATLAQANLLLVLGERKRMVVRAGLWATLGLMTVLAVLLWLLILTNGDIGSDGYGRAVGTVAILDVLGTIVVPVVSRFLRDDAASANADAGSTLSLPPELSARLEALAAERGTTAEALAVEAVEELLRSRE